MLSGVAKQRVIFISLLVACNLVFARVSLAQVNMGFSVWELVTDGPCAETITFMGDEVYLLESGAQLITKTYKFKQFRETEFFLLTQRTSANNDLADCAGVVGLRVGKRSRIYAKFNREMNQMDLYSKPEIEQLPNKTFRKK
jgi:hypothetical protein